MIGLQELATAGLGTQPMQRVWYAHNGEYSMATPPATTLPNRFAALNPGIAFSDAAKSEGGADQATVNYLPLWS